MEKGCIKKTVFCTLKNKSSLLTSMVPLNISIAQQLFIVEQGSLNNLLNVLHTGNFFLMNCSH